MEAKTKDNGIVFENTHYGKELLRLMREVVWVNVADKPLDYKEAYKNHVVHNFNRGLVGLRVLPFRYCKAIRMYKGSNDILMNESIYSVFFEPRDTTILNERALAVDITGISANAKRVFNNHVNLKELSFEDKERQAFIDALALKHEKDCKDNKETIDISILDITTLYVAKRLGISEKKARLFTESFIKETHFIDGPYTNILKRKGINDKTIKYTFYPQEFYKEIQTQQHYSPYTRNISYPLEPRTNIKPLDNAEILIKRKDNVLSELNDLFYSKDFQEEIELLYPAPDMGDYKTKGEDGDIYFNNSEYSEAHRVYLNNAKTLDANGNVKIINVCFPSASLELKFHTKIANILINKFMNYTDALQELIEAGKAKVYLIITNEEGDYLNNFNTTYSEWKDSTDFDDIISKQDNGLFKRLEDYYEGENSLFESPEDYGEKKDETVESDTINHFTFTREELHDSVFSYVPELNINVEYFNYIQDNADIREISININLTRRVMKMNTFFESLLQPRWSFDETPRTIKDVKDFLDENEYAPLKTNHKQYMNSLLYASLVNITETLRFQNNLLEDLALRKNRISTENVLREMRKHHQESLNSINALLSVMKIQIMDEHFQLNEGKQENGK